MFSRTTPTMTIPEPQSTTEEAGDELYKLYLNDVSHIEQYDEADRTMITVKKEHARKKFFEEIKKRRERAPRLVETNFSQDKTPSVTELVKRETKGEQQREASSVQYTPTITPPPPGSYGNEEEPELKLLQPFDITEDEKTYFNKEVLDSHCAHSTLSDYSAAEKLVKDELKVFEMVVKGISIDRSRFKAFLKREMNQTLKNLIDKYKKQQLPERDLRKFKDLLLKDGLRFVREYFRIELTANEIENPIERVISFTEEERKVLKNQAEKSTGWWRMVGGEELRKVTNLTSYTLGKELDYQVVQQQFAHQQWQDFEKVTNLNRATLEILIENSNSRRTFFLQTLVKNDYNREGTNVLNRSLAEEWMMFFKKVPNVSFQHDPLGHQGQNPAQELNQPQKSS